MMYVYAFFGLTVACDLELSNGVPGDTEQVEVRIVGDSAATVPGDPPPGVVLSEIRGGDGMLAACTTRVSPERVVLRLPGIVEFTIDPVSGLIRYVRDPCADVDLIRVFVTGLCLATYLQVTGHDILHASAVHVPELAGTLAFVGQSGSGKSTMATVMSTAGCALVADDILRLDRAPDGFLCHRGAVETRLRPKAADLAAGFADVSSTGDQRLAVRLPAVGSELTPLRAIIFPGPNPAASRVELTRLGGAQALFTLMSYPRLLNWQDPEGHQRTFGFLADLADRVPIFASDLPWGPPFAPDLATQVLAELTARPELAVFRDLSA